MVPLLKRTMAFVLAFVLCAESLLGNGAADAVAFALDNARPQQETEQLSAELDSGIAPQVDAELAAGAVAKANPDELSVSDAPDADAAIARVGGVAYAVDETARPESALTLSGSSDDIGFAYGADGKLTGDSELVEVSRERVLAASNVADRMPNDPSGDFTQYMTFANLPKYDGHGGTYVYYTRADLDMSQGAYGALERVGRRTDFVSDAAAGSTFDGLEVALRCFRGRSRRVRCNEQRGGSRGLRFGFQGLRRVGCGKRRGVSRGRDRLLVDGPCNRA